VLCDVNVLLYAFRRDTSEHGPIKAWLEAMIADDAAYGVSELVLSGVVRIATHPKVFPRAESDARGA